MSRNEHTFGDRLKKIRKAKKLTKEKTAELMGITTLTYSRYERNIRKPDLDFVKKFGNHFNINFNWLIDGVGEPFRDAAMKIDENEEKRREMKGLIKRMEDLLD